MDDYYDSVTIWTEDDLENFFDDIKKKVNKAWEKGFNTDIDMTLKFFPDYRKEDE